MRRLFLFLSAASLIGGPALAFQPSVRDEAWRARAQFENYQAQAQAQSAYAAQQQAQTALTLRQLELDRARGAPGDGLSAQAALAYDRMLVDEAQQRADAARIRSLETEAQLRQIDAWLNARRR